MPLPSELETFSRIRDIPLNPQVTLEDVIARYGIRRKPDAPKTRVVISPDGSIQQKEFTPEIPVSQALMELEMLERCVEEKVFFLDLVSARNPFNFHWPNFHSYCTFSENIKVFPRLEAVHRELDRWAGSMKNYLLEVVFCAEVYREFEARAGSFVTPQELSALRSIWFQTVRNNSSAFTSGAPVSANVLKLLGELQNSLKRRVEETNEEKWLIGRAHLSNMGHKVPPHKSFFKAFSVKDLGAEGGLMFHLPRQAVEFYKQHGLTFERLTRVPREDGLLETITGLWDSSFESNYASFDKLVKTAKALL